MPLTTGTKLGPYEILSPLGAGGMGEVYRARDSRLGREVAVKVLPEAFARDPDRLARFEREAKAVAALSHPNILAIFDYGRDGDTAYSVTELLEGQNLKDRLALGRLSPKEAVALGIQAARGLAAAHDKGIVHRDIKPDNLFLTRDGTLKILDFGLSRSLVSGDEEASTKSHMTSPGTVMGTVGYMSPEQVRGQKADHRSDLFSLGCVLYEMLAGRRAFEGESAADTLSAVLRETPHPLPGPLEPKLTQVVFRCLAKRPGDRFSSALELVASLEDPSPAGQVASAALPLPGGLQTLAVLPFSDLSANKTIAHISEGIAEEIINALVRVPGLRVLARTSTFQFGSAGTDPRQAAAELGAGLLVTGSVRKAGRRLRVTTQLVDVARGVHVWSEVFDKVVTDIFAIEEEIAQAVARHLSGDGSKGDATKVDRPGTRNTEALELYLRGRYLWSRRPGKVVWQALRCFERAADLDPTYAAPLAGIADVYATLGSWESGVLPSREAQAKAQEYTRRALEIDPASPEALTTLAYTTVHYDWDPRRAEAGFLEALRHSPGSAASHHWYSHALVASGRFEESLEASRKFLFYDPTNPLATAHLSWHYFMARRPAQALEEAERIVALDPAFQWGHYFLGWALEGLGEADRAVEAMRAAERCNPDNPVMAAGLGRALAVAGERREALAVADHLAQVRKDEGSFSYEIGLVHLGLGDRDRALDCLETTHGVRGGWIAYINADPRLDPLRTEERFEAMVPPALRWGPPEKRKSLAAVPR